MKALLPLALTILSSFAFAETEVVIHPQSAIQGPQFCKQMALERLVELAGDNLIYGSSFRLVKLDIRPRNLVQYAWYEMDVQTNTQKQTIETVVEQNRVTGRCYQ